MIGKPAVDLAEKLDHFAPQSAKQGAGSDSAYAVAAVDGDFHAAFKLDVADDAANVVGKGRVSLCFAFLPLGHGVWGSMGLGRLHQAFQRLYLLTEQRFARHHHFEAVVI